MKPLAAFAALCAAASLAHAKCPPHIEAEFRTALAARSETQIIAAVSAARACMGDPRAETPERYEAPMRLLKQPDDAQRDETIDAYWSKLSTFLWWELTPTPNGQSAHSPLRAPAALLHGAAMAVRDDPDNADHYRQRGDAAAAYLLKAQVQGGAGLFPTPAWEGASTDRVRSLTDQFVKKARKDGVLERVVRNGWIVDDRGAGDLQFDNGLSGEAILAWHAVAPRPEYMAAARAAGDWAMQQPLSTNFNYNGFSAAFLARLGAATGDRRYTDESAARIRLGVLPGMIAEGPYAGHWVDPHNERLVYRLFMIRQMAVVASALPKDHPDRGFIIARLQMALDAAEDQQRAVQKIAHWEASAKAYCALSQLSGVRSKAPDVASLVRDRILAGAMALTATVDPHAFHCALAIKPAYPNLEKPWEQSAWPK